MIRNAGILMALIIFTLGTSEFVPDKDCIFNHLLKRNKTYYWYSSEYPFYLRGRPRHCRFTGRLPPSDERVPGLAEIKVTCPDIDFRTSGKCKPDFVNSITINVYRNLCDQVSDGNRTVRICGIGGINTVFQTEKIDIDWNHYTFGRFSCSITAQYTLKSPLIFISDIPPPAPDCLCGRAHPNAKRNMLNEDEVGINQYPFLAALVLHKDNKTEFYCSAAIISNRYALSEAQCYFYSQFSGGVLKLWVGDHNIKIGNETNQSKQYEIVMIPHKEWSMKELHFNDIMLVKTTNFIKFSYGVQPVCLPYNAVHESYVGKQLKMLGWGNHLQNSSANYSDVPTEVRTILSTDCQKLYTDQDSHTIEYKRKIWNRTLCTTNRSWEHHEYHYGKCYGDDASLLIGKNITFGRYVLLGILSLPGCVTSGRVDYFVRVDRYLDWIKENTQDSLAICRY